MAEAERDQKTEDATPKKRQDSARKGDVLASRELSAALAIGFGTAWLALAGGWAMRLWAQMLGEGLRLDPQLMRDFDIGAQVVMLMKLALLPLATLMATSLLAAFLGPVLLGAMGFRGAALRPKLSRIDPLAGLKRIFGLQGVIELGKAIAKALLLGVIIYQAIADDMGRIISAGTGSAPAAAALAGSLIIKLLIALTLGLIVIAALDVPLQFRQRQVRLRMTKQEVRDEHKESEGASELKQAMRARQHAILAGSARKAVTEASVILTNPTHFAVALRYRPGEDTAPVMVARGRGAAAQAIRDLGTQNQIPTLDYPQLTRALYFTTRPGQPIAHDLYLAVATVLAFVFNLDAAAAASSAKPDVEVPPAKRFDASGRVASDAGSAP